MPQMHALSEALGLGFQHGSLQGADDGAQPKAEAGRNHGVIG
jgi:hypothetical protein